MKAFRISTKTVWGNEERVEIAEKIENLKINENETVEELCEVENGCVGGFHIINKDGEETFSDYYLESGTGFDDTGNGCMGTHTEIDIEKTNELMRKNGDADFAYWCFDLWVGSYWDGSNWKVVVVEK